MPNICSPGGVHRLPHLLTLLDTRTERNLVQQNARECGALVKWNILVNRVRPFLVSSFAVDSAACALAGPQLQSPDGCHIGGAAFV